MSWALDQDWTLLKRARDLSRAYEIGLREAPAAIYAETSYHVEEFLAGVLPALLQLCIVQALATAIGAGIGAGLGALVFGAGAIPGAAFGAEAGFDLGLVILGWLGLAFLAAAIAHSLGDVVTLLKHAVVQAWQAADAHPDDRSHQVREAGLKLARATAVLVRLILQGIVAWLLKRGIDKAPELIAELKASRLGVAFGEWVEKNLGRLVNDPKLRGHTGEGTTTKVATESTAESPSRLAQRSAEPAGSKPAAAVRDTSVQVEGKTVSAQRVREGSDQVAVIGRNMKGVEPYAESLRAQGVEVNTFNGPKISDAANREFKALADQYGGKIPDNVLVKTQMYAENQAWAQSLVDKGCTVVDVGNPFSAGQSVFYEMEKQIIFGGH
jgi:hypothetical protein